MDYDGDDIVSDLKQTDSQKSVSTNVCSHESAEDISEKLNSSGRETYVLDWDTDSYSSIEQSKSTVSIKETPKTIIDKHIQCDPKEQVNKTSSISRTIFTQETFTQTSKTIIELAANDRGDKIPICSSLLQTQTSFVSVTERKSVEVRTEIPENNYIDAQKNFKEVPANQNIMENRADTLLQFSSKAMVVHNDLDNASMDHNIISTISNSNLSCSSKAMMLRETAHENNLDEYIALSNGESKENIINEEDEYSNNSEFYQSQDSSEDTDMEDDSLMNLTIRDSDSDSQNHSDCVTPKSVANDVAEIYHKLYDCIDLESHSFKIPEKQHCGYLTPLTEESVMKKESLTDITSTFHTNDFANSKEDKDLLFTNNAGMKVKLLPNQDHEVSFKLPPIHNSGRNLDFLFGVCNHDKNVVRTNNDAFEKLKEKCYDSREIGTKELGSGESPHISVRNDGKEKHDSLQLPPIKVEDYNKDKGTKTGVNVNNKATPDANAPPPQIGISIKEKIKELKMSHRRAVTVCSKFSQNSDSRSVSPNTNCSGDNRLSDTQDRSCDVLVAELLKRLRSQAWYEITETLDDVPRMLEKYWQIISEQRIADLIRTVSAHVESPRTQVARAACQTLADILKNTNYTKKPDFYEAITVLLSKTGSFSRPVRRAANLALDTIVCGVDLTHAVTSLCVHGVSHKSSLVRCASARLLVVCCALGGGGKDLLRARPPTAAAARTHALRSLALLLEDKNTETRKYAERLYTMLRPLPNFEAYYLTDVDVDLASRLMKKYDLTLLNRPPKTR